MAATKQQRSTPSRSGSGSRSAPKRAPSARNGSGSGSGAKPQATRARSRASGTTKRAANGTSPKAAAGTVKETTGTVASTAADTASSAVQAVGSAVKSVAVPVGTAVLGAAGGVAIGKAAFGKRRRGPSIKPNIKLPSRKHTIDLRLPGQRGGVDGLAKSVGEAGRQLAKLAGEVHEARKKAADVGKALN